MDVDHHVVGQSESDEGGVKDPMLDSEEAQPAVNGWTIQAEHHSKGLNHI